MQRLIIATLIAASLTMAGCVDHPLWDYFNRPLPCSSPSHPGIGCPDSPEEPRKNPFGG